MEKYKINTNFFEKPVSKLKNIFMLSKYNFSPTELESKNPCIYITQKTSIIDKNLISKCIKDKFVFLKQDIFYKLTNNRLSIKERANLLEEINSLKKFGYSLSILNGSKPSIFGENEMLSNELIFFLKDTGLDIKFITFPGLYFAYPVWSKNPRQTKIYASQKITIKNSQIKFLNSKELVNHFNASLPSSATTYLKKFPTFINSNSRASGLEQVCYACPHCKKILSLYSEFSCLKCKECGDVIELSPEGQILFSKQIRSFDDIQDFQFSQLKKNDMTINKLIQYDKITQIIVKNCKKTLNLRIILQIYAEKIIIINPLTNKKTTVFLEDIENFNYDFGNTITITTKNAKVFHFIGNSNENLLIIQDLIFLNKN